MERCLGTTKLHNGAPCKRERPRLVFLFLFLSCSCSCAALLCSVLRCSLWHLQIAQRSLVQPFTLPLIHPLSQAADRESSTAACPPPVCVPLVPRIRLVCLVRCIRRFFVFLVFAANCNCNCNHSHNYSDNYNHTYHSGSTLHSTTPASHPSRRQQS
ncbi:hypothetical protein GQ42DRAFT_35699 [Ramicandelaber brevisporus]|nr:hypothetical protein GQ42DRAFT_35699 [Ramicandelaber brevisporus]